VTEPGQQHVRTGEFELQPDDDMWRILSRAEQALREVSPGLVTVHVGIRYADGSNESPMLRSVFDGKAACDRSNQSLEAVHLVASEHAENSWTVQITADRLTRDPAEQTHRIETRAEGPDADVVGDLVKRAREGMESGRFLSPAMMEAIGGTLDLLADTVSRAAGVIGAPTGSFRYPGKDIKLRRSDDPWPLMESAERVLRAKLTTWGTGNWKIKVDVSHTGGSQDSETVAEAKAQFTHARYKLKSLEVSASEGRPPNAPYQGIHSHRSASVRATGLESRDPLSVRWAEINVYGPDETAVIGLGKMLDDEVRAARRAGRKGPRQLAQNPWVVTVGGTVIATAIIAILGWA
jgi:hypothetical protein